MCFSFAATDKQKSSSNVAVMPVIRKILVKLFIWHIYEFLIKKKKKESFFNISELLRINIIEYW